MRQCGLCGERGFELGEVEGDTGDAGARDLESEEGECGALGGEARADEEDWVSVIREIPYHEDPPCKYCERYSRF